MSETDVISTGSVEFEGFYNGMGEGVLAAFREQGETMLFNKQGLQHRIIERKQEGIDTRAEEQALAQMNAVMLPRAM